MGVLRICVRWWRLCSLPLLYPCNSQLACTNLVQWRLFLFADEDVCVLQLLPLLPLWLFCRCCWDVFSANPIQSRSKRGISEMGQNLKTAGAQKFFVLFRVSYKGTWAFPGIMYLVVNGSITLLLRFFSTFHFHAPCIHHPPMMMFGKLRFHLSLGLCSTIPTQRQSNPTFTLRCNHRLWQNISIHCPLPEVAMVDVS